MRLQATHWLLVAAGGLLLPATAAADDPSAEGVVRLGNAKTASPSIKSSDSSGTEQAGFRRRDDAGGAPECCPENGRSVQNGRSLQNGRHSARACRTGPGSRSAGAARRGHGRWSGHARYGCPPGGGHGCRHGAGYGGRCGRGGCYNPYCSHLMHALHWLFPFPCGCTVPPDHGFALPGHHPMHRAAVTYRRWFPGQWTGEPSAADASFRYPMVYTPTDTTQLGYYYQRVPSWQRRAGATPPPPHPDEWHVPDYGGHVNGVVNASLIGTQEEKTNGDSDGEADDEQPSSSSPDKASPLDATPVPEIQQPGAPPPPTDSPAKPGVTPPARAPVRPTA